MASNIANNTLALSQLAWRSILIKCSPQQLVQIGRLINQAQPVILVIEIRTDLATASIFRQAIGQVIQADQGRERIVDRGGRGSHSDHYHLVDGMFDILGGGALVADLDAASQIFHKLLIDDGSRPDQDRNFPNKSVFPVC
jgi:hypothetical protein